MNFPYHTESVSQHVDRFKPENVLLKKTSGKNQFFSAQGDWMGGAGVPLCQRDDEINEIKSLKQA